MDNSRTYNRQIVFNSITSIIQVLFVGICSFYIYSYIIQTIGIEKFGLWSLILSFSSLTSIGNFGFGNSLLKYSADKSINSDYSAIIKMLNTTILISSILLLLMCVLLYYTSYFFIPNIVDSKWHTEAFRLLPLSIINLYVNILGGLNFSCLEGLNKGYLRSYATSLTTIVFVALCLKLTPQYGLIGLAYAQIVQSSLFLIFGIIVVIVYLPKYSVFKFELDKSVLKNFISYGFNFQFINILQILYDPVTKIILSKYGNLNLVGYFEMSNKLIQVLRSVVISGIQSIIPKFTILTNHKVGLSNTFSKIFNLSFITGFGTLFFIILNSTVISILWLKKIDNIFILYLTTLGWAWLVNIWCAPAYFLFVGTGDLRPNLTSHFLIAVLNPILSILISKLFPSKFVILGWCLSLIVGSLYLVYKGFNRQDKIKILNKNHLMLLSIGMLFTIISFSIPLYSLSIWGKVLANIFLSIIFILVILINPILQSIVITLKSIIK